MIIPVDPGKFPDYNLSHMAKSKSEKINVSSEVGTLRRLLVHSPDSGLGKVVPSKAQDWLFEDIVHLETIRRKEYDYYTKILLYFLDPDCIKGHLKEIDAEENKRNFYKPDHEKFFGWFYFVFCQLVQYRCQSFHAHIFSHFRSPCSRKVRN